MTVDAAGRYHASFVVDAPDQPLPPVDQQVGIDLGLTHFAVLSDGTKLDCVTLPPVEQGMGAHSAPLGMSFVTSPGLPGGYGPGALVGIHASWNRKPPARRQSPSSPGRTAPSAPSRHC